VLASREVNETDQPTLLTTFFSKQIPDPFIAINVFV
jgi:hypothetical protein